MGEVIFCVYVEQIYNINSITIQIFSPLKEKKHDQWEIVHSIDLYTVVKKI